MGRVWTILEKVGYGLGGVKKAASCNIHSSAFLVGVVDGLSDRLFHEREA